jgi:hypothetical protein
MLLGVLNGCAQRTSRHAGEVRHAWPEQPRTQIERPAPITKALACRVKFFHPGMLRLFVSQRRFALNAGTLPAGALPSHFTMSPRHHVTIRALALGSTQNHNLMLLYQKLLGATAQHHRFPARPRTFHQLTAAPRSRMCHAPTLPAAVRACTHPALTAAMTGDDAAFKMRNSQF